MFRSPRLSMPCTRPVLTVAVVQVQTSDIARGDLVELRTGDKVPADLRIVQSSGLSLNNAGAWRQNPLTGGFRRFGCGCQPVLWVAPLTGAVLWPSRRLINVISYAVGRL